MNFILVLLIFFHRQKFDLSMSPSQLFIKRNISCMNIYEFPYCYKSGERDFIYIYIHILQIIILDCYYLYIY